MHVSATQSTSGKTGQHTDGDKHAAAPSQADISYFRELTGKKKDEPSLPVPDSDVPPTHIAQAAPDAKITKAAPDVQTAQAAPDVKVKPDTRATPEMKVAPEAHVAPDTTSQKNAPASVMPQNEHNTVPAHTVQEDTAQTQPVLGDAILSRLGIFAKAPETVAPEKTVPQSVADGVSRVLHLAEHMAERILVSVPQAGENREVRIQLRHDLLPNTEIRISKQDGILQIHCLCADINAERIMVQHTESLQAVLEKRFPGEVSVQVRATENQQDGHNDGRSRQQRDIYEELLRGGK